MATKPQFVAKYETIWNDTANASITVMNAVAVQAGDLLVAVAAGETSTIGTMAVTENGSSSWASQVAQTGNSPIAVWTYSVTGNENLTVTFTRVSYSHRGGCCIFHFRTNGGVGAKNNAAGTTGNPAVTLSSVAANSAIVMIVSDWNAKTGTQTANTTIGAFNPATGYPGDGSFYGVLAGYYDDVGNAGNKAVGQTAPTGLDWTIAGIEIKGTAGGGGASLSINVSECLGADCQLQ
jgi:hypothetical protein